MVSGTITGFKNTVMSSALSRTFASLLFNMVGNFSVEGTISVTTSDTIFPLSGVTAPHWCYFRNLDQTNYLVIYNGSGNSATALVKLFPNEPALFPMSDGGAPYGKANTAACLCEYLIFSL